MIRRYRLQEAAERVRLHPQLPVADIAAMHEEWEPDEDTRYSNFVYRSDALLWARRTGQVWDGKVPSQEDAFTNYYYSVPNEGIFWPDSTPIGDYSLPTTDSADNKRLLEDAYEEVMR